MMAVLALAVAGMMLGMSGFSAAWGADPPQTSKAQEELNNSASDLAPQSGPVSGPVSAADSSIVGLLSSGLTGAVEVGGAVALLPVTLINLGFPAWFAVPLGLVGYILTGIGIVEFATNREWT
jgi:hypothetical protein